MAEIRLNQIHKSFEDFTAVSSLDLTVPDGKFFVLLGPSGCGKTTSLRMIAGLERPTSGEIFLDDDEVTASRASDRDIAFVFQHYALYPFMTVRGNIAFPLKTQGVARRERNRRVAEVARQLRLEDRLDEPVFTLFGGDRQRVALGRAIIRHPRAYLMDEPLGTLDAELREHMRTELRGLQDRMQATMVMVTHDQIEAMAMADLVAVMNAGRVLQVGSPMTLYRRPADTFVARFVGSPAINFLEIPGPLPANSETVTMRGSAVPVRPTTTAVDHDMVTVGIRPEYVRLADDGTLAGRVITAEYMGTHHLLTVETELGRLRVRDTHRRRAAPGERIGVSFEGREMLLFDPASGRAVQAIDDVSGE